MVFCKRGRYGINLLFLDFVCKSSLFYPVRRRQTASAKASAKNSRKGSLEHRPLGRRYGSLFGHADLPTQNQTSFLCAGDSRVRDTERNRYLPTAFIPIKNLQRCVSADFFTFSAFLFQEEKTNSRSTETKDSANRKKKPKNAVRKDFGSTVRRWRIGRNFGSTVRRWCVGRRFFR